MNSIRRRSLAWVLAAAMSAPAAAGTGVTVLHAFGRNGDGDGDTPYGHLLVGPDGRLYGTTVSGGAFGYGAIYSVGADRSYSLLHSFSGPDGTHPRVGLVRGAGGTLLGSTATGFDPVGTGFDYFGGVLFGLAGDGSAFAPLYRFGGALFEPGGPGELLDGHDGFFYGTTTSGGPDNVGTVFRWAPGGPPTTLHEFTLAGGYAPDDTLTLGSDGFLYGATTTSYNGGLGAIFRLDRNGQNFNEVRAFTDDAVGEVPSGAMVEIDGVFYGTSSRGTYYNGVVFRMTRSGVATPLHSFNGDDGAGALGPLALGRDGVLYGFTRGDGYGVNNGTVFRLSTRGDFTTLALLTDAEGKYPGSPAVFGADGLLYGTMGEGKGAVAGGSVIQLDALAQQPAQIKMDKVCNKSEFCPTPVNLGLGQPYTIYWKTANVTRCIGSGNWRGSKPVAGHLDLIALRLGTLNYQLDCSGPGGSSRATLTVTVGH